MTEPEQYRPPVLEAVPQWAKEYDSRSFLRWSLTVDILALVVDLGKDSLEVATVERGGAPFKGQQALPGGFVQPGDETGLKAAVREFREEAEVSFHGALHELGTYDADGRDPRQWAGHLDERGEWVWTGTRVASRAFIAPRRKEETSLSTLPSSDAASSGWAQVYQLLPWEDLRCKGDEESPKTGVNRVHSIVKELEEWAASVSSGKEIRGSIERLFSTDDWDEEQAGDRYRLLRMAGLVEESQRDEWGRVRKSVQRPRYGRSLAFDHREILADAVGWMRVEIKRQPALVAALMPADFTLAQLQALFEVISGRDVYRANFRRLVTTLRDSKMAESTGIHEDVRGPGRPAEKYRLLKDVVQKRYSPGLTLPWRPLTNES